jgi:acetoin utilization protein AcuB
MKTIPMISKFMTTTPHTVGTDIPLKKAIEMMREHRIRHLPVMRGGRLEGVLTDRDIKLAASFQGAAEMRVDDVMSPDAFAVSPKAGINDVAAEMAERKYGCAVVVDNGKVVGIFTATDGMRVLADVVKNNYKA